MGKKSDVFCHVLLWYVLLCCSVNVLFCHVVSCSVLSCHVLVCNVVFCRVRRGREAGHPGLSGILGDPRDNLGSGGRGMQGHVLVFVEGEGAEHPGALGNVGGIRGLAAAVCRAGLAGGAVLEI